MSVQHQFGGDWTDQKLNKLRQYLEAYMTIFRSNEKAQHLRTIYVDAFAGTGSRVELSSSSSVNESGLFDDLQDVQNIVQYRDGSARIALSIPEPFDEYIFVEKKVEHVTELERLRDSHSNLSISIVNDDANMFLQSWCRQMRYRDRAVVFLDPYGMSVDWSTIESIARTQKIDLWILFPLGMAVNRLLTKKGLPPESWSSALTRFFGEDDWQKEFYRPSPQIGLFDEQNDGILKDTNFEAIGDYFKRRLASVFARVAPNHLTLRNSRNSPLFLLCFAVGNPNKADLAIRIANHILKE